MGKYRTRLVDATRRLLKSGTGENEALLTLTEIGIGKKEANAILSDAKKPAGPSFNGGKTQKPEHDSFWDAPVGTYFGSAPTASAQAEGKYRKVLSFFKWLIR